MTASRTSELEAAIDQPNNIIKNVANTLGSVLTDDASGAVNPPATTRDRKAYDVTDKSLSSLVTASESRDPTLDILWPDTDKHLGCCALSLDSISFFTAHLTGTSLPISIDVIADLNTNIRSLFSFKNKIP